MKTTKLDGRYFDSTRGRIVSLMRDGSGTVNEPASKKTPSRGRSSPYTLKEYVGGKKKKAPRTAEGAAASSPAPGPRATR